MRMRRRYLDWMPVVVVMLSLLGLTWSSAAVAAPSGQDDHTPVYIVRNVFDVQTRSAIAATGALILEVGHDYILVEATPREARQIAALGLSI